MKYESFFLPQDNGMLIKNTAIPQNKPPIATQYKYKRTNIIHI